MPGQASYHLLWRFSCKHLSRAQRVPVSNSESRAYTDK